MDDPKELQVGVVSTFRLKCTFRFARGFRRLKSMERITSASGLFRSETRSS